MKAVSVVVNWALPLDDTLIAVEGLVVQRVRERQCHGGYLIIPVVADVRRAWHDTAAYLRYSRNGLQAGNLLRCNSP